MKMLRFSINDKLHADLSKTAKELRMLRPVFFEKCLQLGLEHEQRLIEWGKDHDQKQNSNDTSK